MKIFKVEWSPSFGGSSLGSISSLGVVNPVSMSKLFSTKEKAEEFLKQITQASILLGAHAYNCRIVEVEVEE